MLPQNAAEIISGKTILLTYTDEGLKSCGTLDNHKIIYKNYKVVNYERANEGF